MRLVTFEDAECSLAEFLFSRRDGPWRQGHIGSW